MQENADSAFIQPSPVNTIPEVAVRDSQARWIDKLRSAVAATFALFNMAALMRYTCAAPNVLRDLAIIAFLEAQNMITPRCHLAPEEWVSCVSSPEGMDATSSRLDPETDDETGIAYFFTDSGFLLYRDKGGYITLAPLRPESGGTMWRCTPVAEQKSKTSANGLQPSCGGTAPAPPSGD